MKTHLSTSFALGSLLLALVALGGCDYFRPADPEPPSAGATFLPDYSDPDSTLATIARAIAVKGVGIGASAYAGAFAESVTAGSIAGYHQLFWPLDVSAWSTAVGDRPPPGDWGFTLEQNFYANGATALIRLRPDAYQMEWAPDPLNPDDSGAETATIHRHYLVTTRTDDGALNTYLAIGYADLKFIRFSDANWRIVRWEDRRDPNADPGDQEQVTLGRRRLNTQ